MKLPWITLLCCTAAAPAAWFVGHHHFLPPPPPAEPPLIVFDPPPPAPPPPEAPPVEKPPPPAPPRQVLPELLSLTEAAFKETDPLVRQQRLQAAARLLAEASAAEAKELFLTTKDSFLQESAIRRWAELEPRAALDHLLALDAQQASQLPATLKQLAHAVFQGWAHRDPAAAMAEAIKLRAHSGFRHVEYAAAAQVISENLPLGLSFIQKYPPLFPLPNPACRSMWEHQPAAFTRGLFAVPGRATWDGSGLQRGVEAAKVWAAADTAGFTAWAAEHFATHPAEDRFHAELFALLLARDPDTAGKVFAGTPPSPLLNKMRGQYVAAMAASDPQAAAAWIDQNLTSGRADAYRLWAEATAKSAGHEQAATLALTLPPGTARDAATGAALYAWAGENLSAALTWAKAQPAENGGPAPITHLTVLWMQKNAREASHYVLTHPALGWSSGDFRHAALRSPFDEAVKLTRDLPASVAASAAGGIGERLADGTHRISEIASLSADLQSTAIRTAAAEMKYTNPKKAAAWVAALPAGPLRTAGQVGLSGQQ